MERLDRLPERIGRETMWKLLDDTAVAVLDAKSSAEQTHERMRPEHKN